MADKLVKEFNVLELYSGIGGFAFALKDICNKKANVRLNITAMDINTSANEVYRLSHPNHCVSARNILSLTPAELDKMKLHLLSMSPPCQPFTRLGLKKDLNDVRCASFKHLMEILPRMQLPPQALMLENVKGFETSEAFNLLTSTLSEVGYVWRHFLLSPLQFGIPNSRLRYYLLATREPPVPLEGGHIATEVPIDRIPVLDTQSEKWILTGKINMDTANRLEGYLDKDTEAAKEYCLTDDLLAAWHEVFDIVTPSSSSSNCFTRSYGHRLEGTGSIFFPVGDQELLNETYQTVRRMIEKAHDDKIQSRGRIAQQLSKLQLRLFTPTEVARLMHFPRELAFPDNFNRLQKYRLLGNSINVAVVRHLLTFLFSSENMKQ